MASVSVQVWPHSIVTFTAKTQTGPKSPPGCAMDFKGKSKDEYVPVCNIVKTVLHRCFVFVLQRPSSVKNCSTDACALQWRIGPWTQCTATCGRHGFQSRLVTCVHRRTGKATREHHCMWRPRPSSWQRCNVLSCGKGKKKT